MTGLFLKIKKKSARKSEETKVKISKYLIGFKLTFKMFELI
jgi:hypothetical protein